MKPSGRFSAASTAPAGLDTMVGRDAETAGRANTLGGAGGRLNGLTLGLSAIASII